MRIKTRQKVGLFLTVAGGLGLAYIFAAVAKVTITDRVLAWVVVLSTLALGILFVVWGINDYVTKKSQ